jgi:hypothetical protein
MPSIANITAALILDASRFKAQLEGAEKDILRFNRSLKNVGVSLSAAITLPIAALAKSAVDVGSQFEFVQAKIGGLSGQGRIIEGLSKSAKSLGKDTIYTATQISELQLALVKLGLTEQEINDVQGAVVNFAQALDLDLASAGQSVVELLKKMPDSFDQFSSKTQAATYVTDAMAFAVAKSSLDIDGLTSSLNYVGAEANSMGLSFEQTVAILAALANAGYKGSRAGTQLRRILTELSMSGDNATEAFREFVQSGASFQDIVRQVGIRAAGMGAALQDQLPFIDAFEKGMKSSEGYLEGVAGVIEGTMLYSLDRLSSSFDELKITLSEDFAPIIRGIIAFITAMVNAFSALPKPVRVVIVGIAGLLALIGPLTFAIAQYTIVATQAAVASTRLAAALTLLNRTSAILAGITLALTIISAIVQAYKNANKEQSEFLDALKKAEPEQKLQLLRDRIIKLGNDIKNAKEEMDGLAASTSTYTFLRDGVDANSSYNRLKERIEALGRLRAETANLLKLELELQQVREAGIAGYLKDNANRARQAAVDGKTYQQLVKEFKDIEKQVASLQAQAKKGGDISSILGNIEVLNERKDEVKTILEQLGYVFDDSKKQFIDPWTKALQTASDGLERAKAEFSVTGDELARLQALAAVQKELAIAAELLGKDQTKEGLQAFQDFLNLTGQADAEEKAQQLADKIKDINDQFARSNELTDFQFLSGIIDENQKLEQQASALEALGMGYLELGDSIAAAAYLIKANDLRGIIKSATEGEDAAKKQNEEFLSFVQSIGNAVGNIFKDLTRGGQTFAETLKTNMVDALTAVLAKLVAIAVMWGIIAVLSGTGGNVGAWAQGIKAAKFGTFALGQLGLGGLKSQPTNVAVDGQISGHTIYLSNKRALSSYDRTYGG